MFRFFLLFLMVAGSLYKCLAFLVIQGKLRRLKISEKAGESWHPEKHLKL